MITVLTGDCREVLPTLASDSVHCVVTSPPYFGLRNYGVEGQLGLEATPEAFVGELVAVFREVRRVLRDDGTLWLNLGDSYNTKNLIGIPWRVAFALQADGWYLRQDIIWSKPNPMPESVTDRCTKAHEYVFLFSKRPRYFFDAEAIAEPGKLQTSGTTQHKYVSDDPLHRSKAGFLAMRSNVYETVNKRSVWTIATQPYAEAHFATFPPDLAETCINAGCPKDGTVLDPFGGAGTTGLVADRLQRNAVLIELSADYADMTRARLVRDAGMFAEIA